MELLCLLDYTFLEMIQVKWPQLHTRTIHFSTLIFSG